METLRSIVDIGNTFFKYYIIVYAVFLFLGTLSGALKLERLDKRRKYKNEVQLERLNSYIALSILVPAHNEELTVCETVKSLMELRYGEYEIIVVDDGSTDNTTQALIDRFQMVQVNKPIRMQLPCSPQSEVYEAVGSKVPFLLIRKVNGGKADALNMGINACRYPYFVTIDADSVLQKDSLIKVVEPVLEDNRVVATGGFVQVINQGIYENGTIVGYKFPTKPLVMLQLLEYSRTFLASRIFLDLFNGNLIISGAFGLFRKDIAIAVGGYDTNVIGEDMELVVKIHAFCRTQRMDYRIAYAPDAICWSQVPETLKDLRTQRRRWHMGLIQSLYLHRNVLFNPAFGAVGVISSVYYLVFECFSPVIELFGFIFIILAFALELLNAQFMIVYYLVFLLFSALVTLTTLFSRLYMMRTRTTPLQILQMIVFSVVECIGFRQLVSFYRLSAFINMRRNRLRWGKITRTWYGSL